jgi:hypothetical protein
LAVFGNVRHETADLFERCFDPTIDVKVVVNVVNWHMKSSRFFVDIANIHPALSTKQNLLTIAVTLNTDIVLIRLLVRHKRLHNKVIQFPRDTTFHTNLPLHPRGDPFLHMRPIQTSAHQSSLTTAFDQLIWFHHEQFSNKPRLIDDQCFHIRVGSNKHTAIIHDVLAVGRHVPSQQLFAVVLAHGLGGHSLVGWLCLSLSAQVSFSIFVGS